MHWAFAMPVAFIYISGENRAGDLASVIRSLHRILHAGLPGDGRAVGATDLDLDRYSQRRHSL